MKANLALLIVVLGLIPPSVQAQEPAGHAPIVILSDADFLRPESGVRPGGLGTPELPYVIEGWRIQATGEPAVRISGTTKHVIVRDNDLTACCTDATAANEYAVLLQRVSHITIGGPAPADGNRLQGTLAGIRVVESNAIALSHNTIHIPPGQASRAGIEDQFSRDAANRIDFNEIEGPGAGPHPCLVLQGTQNARVEANSALRCGLGIELTTGALNNAIERNHVVENALGIRVRDGSRSNRILDNEFRNSLNAHETDGENQWYQDPVEAPNVVGTGKRAGNAWSDYDGVDACDAGVCDRIGDTNLPYRKGLLGTGDRFPVLGPYRPPEVVVDAAPRSGGLPLDVDFQRTVHGDTLIVGYVWRFGDDQSSNDIVPPHHTYWSRGDFEATLTVTDAAGQPATARVPIHVGEPIAPQLSLRADPSEGPRPLLVQLEADVMDDGPTTVAWSFGDGTTATGPKQSHAYAKAGNYTVVATATDRGGLYDSQRITIHVQNEPPTLNVDVTPLNQAGDIAYLVRAHATDPDDGPLRTEIVTAAGARPGPETIIVISSQATPAQRTILVRATDLDGSIAELTKVLDAPVQALPSYADPGIVRLNVTRGSGQLPLEVRVRPDVIDPSGGHVWIDWGDGSTDGPWLDYNQPTPQVLGSLPGLDLAHAHLDWPATFTGPLIGPAGPFGDALYRLDPHLSTLQRAVESGHGEPEDEPVGSLWALDQDRLYQVDRTIGEGDAYELRVYDLGRADEVLPLRTVRLEEPVPMEASLLAQGDQLYVLGGAFYGDGEGTLRQPNENVYRISATTGHVDRLEREGPAPALGPTPDVCPTNEPGIFAVAYSDRYEGPETLVMSSSWTTAPSASFQRLELDFGKARYLDPSANPAHLVSNLAMACDSAQRLQPTVYGMQPKQGPMLFSRWNELEEAALTAPETIPQPTVRPRGVSNPDGTSSLWIVTTPCPTPPDCNQSPPTLQLVTLDGFEETATHQYVMPGNVPLRLFAIGHDAPPDCTQEACLEANMTVQETETIVPVLGSNPHGLRIAAVPPAGRTPLHVRFHASFADATNPDDVDYAWAFGDGTLSTERAPSHTYRNPGAYTVRLVAFVRGDGSVNEASQDVLATQDGDELTVHIHAEVAGPSVPTIVSFGFDLEGADPEFLRAFEWTLPDGTTSDLSHPSLLLDEAGAYQVALTVRDVFGRQAHATLELRLGTPASDDPISLSVQLARPDGTPYESATAPPPVVATFVALTRPGLDLRRLAWDWGDGRHSEGTPTAVHAYTRAGLYDVHLYAEATDGTAYDAHLELRITAGTYARVEAPSNCRSPCTIQFSANLPPAPAEAPPFVCDWAFGDGGRSRDCEGTHVYVGSGRYHVRLQLLEGEGGDPYVEDANEIRVKARRDLPAPGFLVALITVAMALVPRRRHSTGLDGLDSNLDGGLRPGTTLLALATPTGAPHDLLSQFAAAGLRSGDTVYYYSLDRPKALVEDDIARLLDETEPGRLELLDGYGHHLKGLDAQTRERLGIPAHPANIANDLLPRLLQHQADVPLRIIVESLSKDMHARGIADSLATLDQLVALNRSLGGVALVSMVAGLHPAAVEIQAQHIVDAVLELGTHRRETGLLPYLSVTKLNDAEGEARTFSYHRTPDGLRVDPTRRVS